MNYFTKNPERAARMESWSGIIKGFQDGLTGMPEEDKMRLPGKLIERPRSRRSERVVVVVVVSIPGSTKPSLVELSFLAGN